MRDRPPIPPLLEMGAIDVYLLGWVQPLQSTRQKIKKREQVWKISALGDRSSAIFGNFGHECGRHGSEWAHTLGKRRHGLQEGF